MAVFNKKQELADLLKSMDFKTLLIFQHNAYDIQILCTGSSLKKNLPLIVLCILFVFLLLFPVQALASSKTGLILWFDSLLPTLLPFLIISQLILKTPIISYVQSLIGPLFRKLFHCSDTGAFCMLCGFLCGYPVGARLIALQIQENNLTLPEGQYLLSFCNNVSPMFCISYGILYAIGAKTVLPYLLIIYGSPLFFGLLTRPAVLPDKTAAVKKQTSSAENLFQLIDVCIIDSFLIMIKLCGYLILFSMISTGILMIIPLKTPLIPSLVTSFLEITDGLSRVTLLPQGIFRTAVCIAALSFGGLCCIFQTNSVINGTGLSFTKYILHKVLITLLALLFFFLWCFFCSFTINGRS